MANLMRRKQLQTNVLQSSKKKKKAKEPFGMIGILARIKRNALYRKCIPTQMRFSPILEMCKNN